MGVAPLEDVMFFDVYDDIQIAALRAGVAGFAFTGDAQPRTVTATRRHLDFEHLFALNAAFAVTGAAMILDHLAGAATGRTGAANRKKSLLITHLAAASTGRAARRLRAFCRTASVTYITMF